MSALPPEMGIDANPIVSSFGCCARAKSGHAAAPPRRPMNYGIDVALVGNRGGSGSRAIDVGLRPLGCSIGNSGKNEVGAQCSALTGAVVAPDEQKEPTMHPKETNLAETRELTDAELAGVAGGVDLPDSVKFFIAALASPAPYDPKNPDYSGYGHVIGTCPR